MSAIPNKPDLAKATDFMWHTARLLDRHRFSYQFLKGEAQAVLAALRPYQNPDGGFGNALEPDLRGPVSLPMPTWVALGILDEINAFTEPMVQQICDYLLTITTTEGGVPFVLTEAIAYPHAPWWETDEQPPASLNPTAAIAALLHKHQVRHPWLDRATEYCWRQIAAIETTSPYEMRAVLPFLDFAPDRAQAEQAFARVGQKILEQKLVAIDPVRMTETDTHSPLNFAPRPSSLARQLFADNVIEAHLDHLAAAQAEDGGWPINWPSWTPAAGLEWRGWMTIDALMTLRAYNRF